MNRSAELDRRARLVAVTDEIGAIRQVDPLRALIAAVEDMSPAIEYRDRPQERAGREREHKFGAHGLGRCRFCFHRVRHLFLDGFQRLLHILEGAGGLFLGKLCEGAQHIIAGQEGVTAQLQQQARQDGGADHREGRHHQNDAKPEGHAAVKRRGGYSDEKIHAFPVGPAAACSDNRLPCIARRKPPMDINAGGARPFHTRGCKMVWRSNLCGTGASAVLVPSPSPYRAFANWLCLILTIALDSDRLKAQA